MLPILETKAQVRITLVTDSSFLYYCLTKLTNMNQSCLNCNEPISKKFCPNCGQKTDTHRITFKHFIFHDILHGVWHLERGIFFTLKESLFRPGKAALDYISGKRIRYYNVFYLILLIIGLGIFIDSIYTNAKQNYVSFIVEPPEPTSDTIVLGFIAKYAKLFLLLAIPVFSFNSYLLFNKKKLNYSEHIILFGMFYLGIILISIVGNLFYFFEFIESLSFLTEFGYYFTPIITFIYLINGFYGAFGKDYKLLKFSFRLLLFIILIFIYLRILGMIIKFFLLKQ